MGLFGFGSSSGIVGLDIGADSIKATELQPGKEESRLITFGMISVPTGTIHQGEILNPGDLVMALKELRKNTNFNSNSVAIGLSGPNVIVKNIVVPYMERSELEHSLYWEAEQHIPMDINECNISFDILGNPSADQSQMDVVIAAAKKSHVTSYIDVLRDSGFTTSVVDISSIALENMYTMNYPVSPDRAVILCDIGAQQIKLSVVDGGIGVFNRDIDLGAMQFTEEIRNQLGVSFEEAENLKMGEGAQEIPVEVRDILTSVSQMFAGEIQRSLDFYLASASNHPISMIYLAGGGSLTTGLKEVIQERTNFPVEHLNPFARVTYSERQFSAEKIHTIGPLAAVSVGLALRAKS